MHTLQEGLTTPRVLAHPWPRGAYNVDATIKLGAYYPKWNPMDMMSPFAPDHDPWKMHSSRTEVLTKKFLALFRAVPILPNFEGAHATIQMDIHEM